jgi:hypothetical protein
MSYAVFQYYQNGGVEAEIVRVATLDGNDDEKAKAATLDLGGGVKLVAASVGEWASSLRTRVDYDTKPKEKPSDPDMYNLTVRNMETGEEESFRNIEAKGESPRTLSKALASSSLVRVAEGSNPSGRPPESPEPTGDDPFADPPPTPTEGGEAPIGEAGGEAAGGEGGEGAGGGEAAGGGETGEGAGGAAEGGAGGGGAAAEPEKPFAQAEGGQNGKAPGVAELKGDDGDKTGMYALRKLGNRIFNLLCIPSTETLEFLDEAAKLCLENRALLLVDPPTDWTSVSAAAEKAAANPVVGGDGAKNAAIFFPRLQLLDDDGNLGVYPPCGAVAGVIARTDGQRGVWKAPAGTDASVSGVRGLTVPMTNLEHGRLNPLGVNCIRNFPVIGNVVWGSRTVRGADQLADQWKYLPVRRTALFIEESLYRGTQWVVFEPNDEPLWASIRLNVGAFMNSLWRQGAFQGTTAQDAYVVKCDAENNPQNDIDRGIVNILVGFAPLKPAEFVLIHIQQLAGQIQT